MLCNSYDNKILHEEFHWIYLPGEIKLLLVTVNNRLILEIEIVYDLSCHPILFYTLPSGGVLLVQLIETASSCLQLCVPQPLWLQLKMWVSDPVHATWSIQMFVLPAPYLFPSVRPNLLKMRKQTTSQTSSCSKSVLKPNNNHHLSYWLQTHNELSLSTTRTKSPLDMSRTSQVRWHATQTAFQTWIALVYPKRPTSIPLYPKPAKDCTSWCQWREQAFHHTNYSIFTRQ